MERCGWVPDNDESYRRYHDEEWGVPVHDEIKHFEMLVLEGAQAGLSWSTILKRREGYREAFEGFDPEKVAKYDDEKVELLLNDTRIIRNRRKIESAILNARIFLEIRKEFGSFDSYIWGFVDGRTIHNEFDKLSDIPSKTEISERISKDLKRRGMNFVGPTIIYAHMQSIGMVNDHQMKCFRYGELKEMYPGTSPG